MVMPPARQLIPARPRPRESQRVVRRARFPLRSGPPANSTRCSPVNLPRDRLHRCDRSACSRAQETRAAWSRRTGATTPRWHRRPPPPILVAVQQRPAGGPSRIGALSSLGVITVRRVRTACRHRCRVVPSPRPATGALPSCRSPSDPRRAALRAAASPLCSTAGAGSPRSNRRDAPGVVETVPSAGGALHQGEIVEHSDINPLLARADGRHRPGRPRPATSRRLTADSGRFLNARVSPTGGRKSGRRFSPARTRRPVAARRSFMATPRLRRPHDVSDAST